MLSYDDNLFYIFLKVHKIFGAGPKLITSSMVSRVYKYVHKEGVIIWNTLRRCTNSNLLSLPYRFCVDGIMNITQPIVVISLMLPPLFHYDIIG